MFFEYDDFISVTIHPVVLYERDLFHASVIHQGGGGRGGGGYPGSSCIMIEW